jgi:hypothetical protein
MGQLPESTPHPGLNFNSITSWQQKNEEQVDEYAQALTKVLLNPWEMRYLLRIY